MARAKQGVFRTPRWIISEPQVCNAAYCAGSTQQLKLNESNATGGSIMPAYETNRSCF